MAFHKCPFFTVFFCARRIDCCRSEPWPEPPPMLVETSASLWIEKAWLPCWPYPVNRCCTRGEPENHTSEKAFKRDQPWLWNWGKTTPKVQNRGINGLKKTYVFQEKQLFECFSHSGFNILPLITWKYFSVVRWKHESNSIRFMLTSVLLSWIPHFVGLWWPVEFVLIKDCPGIGLDLISAWMSIFALLQKHKFIQPNTKHD